MGDCQNAKVNSPGSVVAGILEKKLLRSTSVFGLYRNDHIDQQFKVVPESE